MLAKLLGFYLPPAAEHEEEEIEDEEQH